MNFQQLRFVRAAVLNQFNLTDVASVLFTSQPAVSKQIKDLEAELGIEIFVRQGKRLTGLTKVGEGAVQMIQRILLESENLRRYSSQFADAEYGRLVVAATHNQATYTLPKVVEKFSKAYPKVALELRQGTPRYVSRTLMEGSADIAIATETIDQFPELVTYPCFDWRHMVIVPQNHPLIAKKPLTLADVAAYPVITYNNEFTGRTKINMAFANAGLVPDVRLTAIDADVIKIYTGLGLGVGIVAEMAVRSVSDSDLVVLGVEEKLFELNTTKIALRRGVLLHKYAYRFIEMLAPHLKEADLIRSAKH